MHTKQTWRYWLLAVYVRVSYVCVCTRVYLCRIYPSTPTRLNTPFRTTTVGALEPVFTGPAIAYPTVHILATHAHV